MSHAAVAYILPYPQKSVPSYELNQRNNSGGEERKGRIEYNIYISNHIPWSFFIYIYIYFFFSLYNSSWHVHEKRKEYITVGILAVMAAVA